MKIVAPAPAVTVVDAEVIVSAPRSVLSLGGMSAGTGVTDVNCPLAAWMATVSTSGDVASTAVDGGVTVTVMAGWLYRWTRML